MNIFQGGFLGLDNIGVFDRSAPLPTGGNLEQSDGTSWMAMFTLGTCSRLRFELARHNPAYEDVASKFWEHFLYIANAMNHRGGDGFDLWDEEDGFYYDVLRLPDESNLPLRVRSMVGLIPLFAVETLEPETLDKLPGFKRRLEWFIAHRPDLMQNVASMGTPGMGERRLLSVVPRDRLRRVLHVMLDQREFLSPYGIRALSAFHRAHPYAEARRPGAPGRLRAGRIDDRPLRRQFQLARPDLVSRQLSANRVPAEIPSLSGRRLSRRVPDRIRATTDLARGRHGAFQPARADLPARRAQPASGVRRSGIVPADRFWRDLVLFYEYFHGDTGEGLGASHQTGWTSLVAKLLQQSGVVTKDE